MVTIRLQRRGRTNDPSFRVIVVDSKRGPKTGSYVELLGSYDPRTDRVELNVERVKHWLSKGAKVSDTVHNLLISQKIIEGKKINVLPRFVAPAPAETPAESAEAPQAQEDNSVAQEEAAQ